jgi:hypothetical protein
VDHWRVGSDETLDKDAGGARRRSLATALDRSQPLSGIPYISIRVVTRTRQELQDLERAMKKQTGVGDRSDYPYVLCVDRPPAARKGDRQVG